ncbi:hypothetical protein DOJK_01658 [Patescibacteria group bacterium]|nr:hypothetical protein DOJK_01658 [Patescibacteria group bacterium]
MTVLMKIKQANANIIAKDSGLDDMALELLAQYSDSSEYLNQLIEQKLYPDAVRFLANALPKREATWWACLCARHVLNDKTPPAEVKAIELAEAWVYKPNEDTRKPTLAAAEAVSHNTPASWAAMSAFWSGNDISPTPQAIIPPSETLYAKAVIGAVMLAATQVAPDKVADTYQLFLQQGIDIANGGDGRSKTA